MAIVRISLLIILLATAILAQGTAPGPAELVRDARAAQAENRSEDAIALLEQALAFFDPTQDAQRSNVAFLLNELSVLHRGMGANRPAFDHADRAVRLTDSQTKQWPTYLVNRGLAALDLQDFGSAKVDLTQAAALTDDAALATHALHALAATHLALGETAETVATVAKLPTPDTAARALIVRAHIADREVGLARAAVNTALAEASVALTPETIDLSILNARVGILEGRFDAAQTELQTALTQADELGRPARAQAASALYNLSEIEFMRGRFTEADVLNQRAERAFAAAFGADHYTVAQTGHRRAVIFQELGDLERAVDLYAASGALLSQVFEADHPLLVSSRAEQAQTLARLGRHDEARSLAENLLPSIADVDAGYTRVLAQAAYGLVQYEAGLTDAAFDALRAVRALRADAQYPVIDEPPGLNALAEMYLAKGDVAAAQAAITRAIVIQRRTGGRSLDRLGESRRIEANILRAQGDNTQALAIARDNVTLARNRLIELSRDPSYGAEFAPVMMRRQIAQVMSLLWQDTDASPDSATLEEMFQAAQLLHLNETSRATNGFVARLDPEDDAIKALFAERRLATEELRALEITIGQTSADAQDTTQIAALDRIETLRSTRTDLDARLEAQAPALFGILSPRPIPLADLQARLSPTEAFVLQASFDDGTYIFLIGAETATVARTSYTAAALEADVTQLRASVDVTSSDGMRPFDFASATRVFDGIFGPFQDRLKDHETLIVTPDLSAQQVSLAMLARVDPSLPPEMGAGHPDLRFLGLSHALNIVPSPTAFLRLRSAPALNLSGGGFLGFGDPVLRGDGTGDTRGMTRAINRSTRLANPDVIANMFEPLPETAQELAWMAENQDPILSRIILGSEASETAVKTTDYTDVNIVAFATHAVVSGDFDHLSEPALIMTPPEKASAIDDGLLTASEIALLPINADIVVLSACNTGSSSGRRGAPGLSGLATGFFRAGARSVVVSHWTILSISSLVIMPTFFDLAAGSKPVPPAEAMRQSMLKVANDSRAEAFSHPAVWAPFSMVGI